MTKKLIIGLIILIVIAAVAFSLYKNDAAAPTSDQADSQLQSQPQTEGNPTTQTASQEFIWTFADAGTGEENFAPMTKVTLSTADKKQTFDLGTHVGSCSEIKGSSWTLLENETTGAICWWAGGGTELGVFMENGRLVVKSGELDEGSAETAGFRGNFKTLLTVGQ